MPRGKRTPRDLESVFRGYYLRNNNAVESARLAKVPKGSAESLAKRANDDPKFRKARDELLARGHEKAHLAVLETLDIVLDALRAGPLTDSYDSPIDRRAELARALTGIYDSLDRAKARIEDREEKRKDAAAGADRPQRIEIVRYTTATAAPEPAPEPPADPCKSE